MLWIFLTFAAILAVLKMKGKLTLSWKGVAVVSLIPVVILFGLIVAGVVLFANASGA